MKEQLTLHSPYQEIKLGMDMTDAKILKKKHQGRLSLIKCKEDQNKLCSAYGFYSFEQIDAIWDKYFKSSEKIYISLSNHRVGGKKGKWPEVILKSSENVTLHYLDDYNYSLNISNEKLSLDSLKPCKKPEQCLKLFKGFVLDSVKVTQESHIDAKCKSKDDCYLKAYKYWKNKENDLAIPFAKKSCYHFDDDKTCGFLSQIYYEKEAIRLARYLSSYACFKMKADADCDLRNRLISEFKGSGIVYEID
jgi:hypothetical protein